MTVEQKIESTMGTFRGIQTPIDKYMWLRDLYTKDFDLYFAMLLEHTEEILPFIYTPTVGEACQKYGDLGIKTRGLYITNADKGQILAKLQAWPHQDIRVIVVTDGERILGLGDLGAGGMGISEGKITLYTAAAGVDPHQCLPVCLDVGTNNETLRNSPTYQGLKQPRLTGADYHELVDEFMTALRTWRPHTLLQFEDFGNHTAFEHLEKFRTVQCCFNDDIQGTACIALAGMLAGLRLSGSDLKDQVVLFHGAGEAGVGIGELIAMAIAKAAGTSLEEARKKCFFMDSKGLICAERLNPEDPKMKLQHHKIPFAHDRAFIKTLDEAVKTLRPRVLIGVSTQASSFTPAILRLMSEINERPIIFPLSNPTHLAECTFEEAMANTQQRVVFASGSPFPPMEVKGVTHYPAQANNAYIFPAVGHAAILTNCKSISDEVFLVAAEALASMSSDADLRVGLLFPRFSGILGVSASLIARVAEFIVASGLGENPKDFSGDWETYARSKMWSPSAKL